MGECGEETGTLGSVGHGPSVQRGRIGCVQSAPLGRQEIVIHRLGKQGMPKPVRAGSGRVADQKLGGERLAERLLQVGLGQCGHFGEELGFDGSPVHCSHPEHPLGVLGHRRHAREQDLAEGLGKRRRLSGGTVAGGEELLDEEGVALGATSDGFEQVGFRSVPQDRLDLGVELRSAEWRQFESSNSRQPVHLR